jgi:SAM-dependent methyltransferase
MDTATIREQRLETTDTISTLPAASTSAHSLLANPFEIRYGRRYLRDVPYPLPCDLSEIQRQSLRTMLGVTVFNKPSCVPKFSTAVPGRVLELGCGSAFWTSSCHEWFASLGHPHVEFTGLDYAPLAPDLRRQGVNWTFVQHDYRRYPWPFENASFDYIMLKDLSLSVNVGENAEQFVDETLRILAPKGTLEIWESDHVLRCLLPNPPPPRGMTAEEDQIARDTKTYLISTATPFAPAQNKYIADSNAWIHTALDKLNLPSSPCTRMAQILFQETSLMDVTSRRIAIPLGQMMWEKDSQGKLNRSGSSGNLFGTASPKGKSKASESMLTEDQAAVRSTAILTVIQQIESLEPLLKEVSGKNSEEWTRWWSNMMASLLDQETGGGSGEVLEIGAWWATRCD